MAAGLSAITLIAQAATLPRMPSLGSARLGTLVEVLRRHGVAVGMICAMLVFIGHFAFFTYLRPFLEFTTGAGIAMISSVLLGFGVANLFGTLLAGFMLERSLRATLASMPLVMAIICASSRDVQQLAADGFALIALWGMAFGAVPVAWSTGSPAPFPTKLKVQVVCSSPRYNSPLRSGRQAAARSTISRERPPSSEPAAWFCSPPH